MAEVVGYFLLFLAFVSLAVAGYSMVMTAMLMLRSENQIPDKIWRFPVTHVVWTDTMGRHFRTGFFAMILFMFFGLLGTYFADLQINANGIGVQGGQ